jgi:hypothetical protein
MRRLTAVLLAFAALAAGGCGGDDVERAVDRARTQAEELRRDVERAIKDAQREFEERRRQFGERLDEVLGGVAEAIERPERTSPVVRSRGRNEPATIDAFMTDILRSIDRFWTRTLTASDLPEPQVRYLWVPPGASVLTACGERAGSQAAFYCPADDTIYVAQEFAAALYEGVAEGLPGEAAGFGRAAGDFAVAYVLAHEYAHNLQQELGVFNLLRSEIAAPYELHADCWAGVWAYSVYAEGELQPGDIEEAANTALAVGDFDVGAARHHGTPEQRRDALLEGFESGDPARCSAYLS